MIKILSAFVTFLVFASSVYAGGTNLFNAKEFAVETFGAYSVKNPSKTIGKGNYGAGIGVSYFIYNNLGISLDTYLQNITGTTIDNLSGSLIFRLPVEKLRTAPYVFGGAGHSFESKRWNEFVGVGLDYRIKKNIGLFSDVRYLFPDRLDNSLLFRGGIKVVF